VRTASNRRYRRSADHPDMPVTAHGTAAMSARDLP
jgi:hypothetical protein